MTATITAPPARPSATVTASATAPFRGERLATGIGALGFAGIVLATNAITGSTPAWDAPAAEVAAFVAEKPGILNASAAGYALGLPFLLAFVAGMAGRFRRLARPEDQIWARLGIGAALLIAPFFSSVVVQRIVLMVGADESLADPTLTTLVWRLEGAAFMLNGVVVGLAAFGVAFAAARAGLAPSWFRFLGVVAGVAGVANGIVAIASLEGGPGMAFGLVAFLSWMVTLLTIGIRTLRATD